MRFISILSVLSLVARGDEEPNAEVDLNNVVVDESMFEVEQEKQQVREAEAAAPAPAPKPPARQLSEADRRRLAEEDRVHQEKQLNRKNKELEEKENQKRKINEHVRKLSTSGKIGNPGAWLYGDYKTIETEDAPKCAEACEIDGQCYHWNYLVEGAGTCSLKRDSGGFNNDATNWISGHANRYVPKVKAAPGAGAASGDI